ncbi:MAG TPA: hypothetical protein PLN54_00990 [Flavobacteriales bacterium]|nr:hypothetical protein [Flavobacteriales bacterium]
MCHTDRAFRAFYLPERVPMPVMRPLTSLLFLFALLHTLHAQDALPIGTWRAHFPYRNTIAVAEGGGHVYCATSTSMFRYQPGIGEIDPINKVNLLNDVGIQGLAWNNELQMLLVYYTNGNLDLIQGDRSFNMGDIKRSSILGNKGIYSVYMEGHLAYLGCGFGIVLVDLQRREVRETWFIGPNGAQVQVNGITVFQDSIYAATNTGLFTASKNAPNLAAYESWRKRADMPSTMANGPFSHTVLLGDQLLLNWRASTGERDTLLLLGTANTWSKFEPLYGRKNRGLDLSSDGQFVVIPHEYDIHMYQQGMSEVTFIFGYDGGPAFPAQAIRAQSGAFWVADRERGLISAQGGDIGTAIQPNGPKTANTWRMASHGGALYVATGALAGNWSSTFLKDGVHHFADGRWGSSDLSNEPILLGVNNFGGAVNDYVSVAVDPDDPMHAWVGTWDDGVVEFRDRRPVAIWNHTNSALGVELNGAEGKVNVAGMNFDLNGNLWMTNAWAQNPVVVRTRDGNWYSFTPGSLLAGNLLLADIVPASFNNFKWIVRPRGNSLLVMDDAGTPSQASDDRWKLVNNTAGSGGLPAPDVYAVAEDLDGLIWVGTSKGPAVFYNPGAIFDGTGWDAQQILIEQDGNVQILLETESVSAIAVDGANRKWMGTQTGGVYLLSADGRTQIHHFTESNSPLPSNTINAITINELTGEVFFATDRGIISYRSDAIAGLETAECAKVFPNPVRETYTGPIAIDGLVRDSEVKITDMAGNLVYRTTSLGGQAIWPGTDMSGNRVATGVYLIFATDRYGSTKCNTKVMVVR